MPDCSSGKYCANLLSDPCLHQEGFGAVRCDDVSHTRPVASIIGLCGEAGLFQTGLLPKNRKSGKPSCRSLDVAVPCGTFTRLAAWFTGSTHTSQSFVQSTP